MVYRKPETLNQTNVSLQGTLIVKLIRQKGWRGGERRNKEGFGGVVIVLFFVCLLALFFFFIFFCGGDVGMRGENGGPGVHDVKLPKNQ